MYLTKNITEVNEYISPLDFYRNHVSKNIPLIIRGGVKHWKAMNKWNISYFEEKIGDKLVNVAVTPNGYADAITKEQKLSGTSNKEYFTLPEERYITMNDFLKTLENPCKNSIYYIQKQNSNFEEFSELWRDIDSDISWATEALGTKPDAINFWMGDQRAITSSKFETLSKVYHSKLFQERIIILIFLV